MTAGLLIVLNNAFKGTIGQSIKNKGQCSCTKQRVSRLSVTPMPGTGCFPRNEAFPFGWDHAIISCMLDPLFNVPLGPIVLFVSSTYTKRMFMTVACYRTFAKWIRATHRIFNVANTKGIRFERWRTENCCARILFPC